MTQRQSFRCSCGEEFETQESLRAHAQQYHAQPAQSFQCAACDGDFETRESLEAHGRAAHMRQ